MKGFHLTSGCFLILVSLLSLQSQLTSAVYSMSETCAHYPRGYIADPDDCQRYGYCADGNLVGTAKCEKGLLYDSRKGTCNYADKVKCATKLSSTCSNIDSPLYVADPDDCTKACYCDGNGKHKCVECPQNMFFNPNQRACVWSKDYSCPANSICRGVPDNTFVADTEVCGNYINCFGGAGVSTSCDPGNWFNPLTGNCADKNICEGSPVTPPPGIGPGIQNNLPSNKAACSDLVFQPNDPPRFKADGKTCFGYFICENNQGSGKWYKCPLGTHFSEADQQCVTPFTVKCLHDRCGNINQQYVSELGCSSYFFCNKQTNVPAYGNNCAALNAQFPYFDEVLGSCVNEKPEYKICTT